jgi:ATP-dependent Clp protease ATP-binding subunit ClpC
VDIMIRRIETQLRNKDMTLELTDNAKRWLAKKGWDPVMGARPLRRTIQREIEDSLSERILFNELKSGQLVLVDCEGDPDDIENSKLVFRGATRETPAEEVAVEVVAPVVAAPGE